MHVAQVVSYWGKKQLYTEVQWQNLTRKLAVTIIF